MKSVSRSAAVVLALFLLLTVHACGAGPSGDCTSRPEQGSCVGQSDDGVLEWYFDEDEFLAWCHDATSPTITIDGGGDVRVDPETGEITTTTSGGDTITFGCLP